MTQSLPIDRADAAAARTTWWTQLRSRATAHPRLIDLAIAALLCATWWNRLAAAPPTAWRSYALAALATLPVAVRRAAPEVAFATSALGLATLLLVGDTAGATAIGAAFIGYSVIVHAGRAAVVPVVAVGALLEALSWWRLSGVTSQSVVLDVLLLAAMVVVAEATRTRQLNVALLAERAERDHRDQAAATQRAVLDERARIARELHDIVAHAMSQISVQAGTGRMLADTQPATAARCLGTIEEVSRNALGEMRRLMGALRDHDPEADLRPGDGVAAIDRLLANAHRAGVEAELTVVGPVRSLPAGVDRAVHRIVQEALTNVIRHAAPTTASVQIEYRPDEVRLRIGNSKPEQSAGDGSGTTHGYGIPGMQERARMLGGRLTAHPTDSGFEVIAALPTGTHP